MTNINRPTFTTSTNNHSNVDCVPQQGAGYIRPVMVAPPAPCGVGSVNAGGQFIVAAIETTAPIPTRILRLPEVISRVGLKRASIYSHMSQGSFPKPIALGPRAVGWVETEIDAWIAVRVQARVIPDVKQLIDQ